MAEKAASALKALSDDALAASLSTRDRSALTELIEEYFCTASASDEEEEEEFGDVGMQCFYKHNE